MPSSANPLPPLPLDVLSTAKSVQAINCSVTARKFVSTLNAQQPVTVRCTTGCAMNVGETDPGWEVFGFGPFRDDSSICKAASVAGVIGESGGVVTLLFAGRAWSFGLYLWCVRACRFAPICACRFANTCALVEWVG